MKIVLTFIILTIAASFVAEASRRSIFSLSNIETPGINLRLGPGARILIDSETGVNYIIVELHAAYGASAAITPRLREDGSLVVTSNR